MKGRYRDENGKMVRQTPWSDETRIVIGSDQPDPTATPEPQENDPEGDSQEDQEETPDDDATRDGATDLGDITAATKTQYTAGILDGDGDSTDYFRFTLTEPRLTALGIRQLDADASITLEDDGGEVLQTKAKAGAEHILMYSRLLEGDYYVRVQATETGENDYKLSHNAKKLRAEMIAQMRERLPSVSEPEGQDFPQDTSTKGRVRIGETATGNLETESGRDWFAVALREGRTYRFDLEGKESNAGTLPDPYLHGIHDQGGSPVSGLVTDNILDGWKRNSRVFYQATRDGDHYVAAGAYQHPSDDHTGTYRLRVRELPPDDYRDDGDTTGRVTARPPSRAIAEYSSPRGRPQTTTWRWEDGEPA